MNISSPVFGKRRGALRGLFAITEGKGKGEGRREEGNERVPCKCAPDWATVLCKQDRDNNNCARGQPRRIPTETEGLFSESLSPKRGCSRSGERGVSKWRVCSPRTEEIERERERKVNEGWAMQMRDDDQVEQKIVEIFEWECDLFINRNGECIRWCASAHIKNQRFLPLNRSQFKTHHFRLYADFEYPFVS